MLSPSPTYEESSGVGGKSGEDGEESPFSALFKSSEKEEMAKRPADVEDATESPSPVAEGIFA